VTITSSQTRVFTAAIFLLLRRSRFVQSASDRPGYQPGPRSRVTCQNAARTVRSAGGRRVGCAGRGSELACPRSCVGEAGSLTAPMRDEVRVSAPPHGPAIWAVRTLESGGVTSSARMRPSRLRLSGQPAPAERVSPNYFPLKMRALLDKLSQINLAVRSPHEVGRAGIFRLLESKTQSPTWRAVLWHARLRNCIVQT